MAEARSRIEGVRTFTYEVCRRFYWSSFYGTANRGRACYNPCTMKKVIGDITVPGDADVWPHEYETARSLARAGHNVTFIKKSDIDHERTPDLLLDGELWEMKSPKASSARAIDRNLRRALRQSSRIVFDCRRMKNLPDAVVERELRKAANDLRSLKRLLFVNHRGEVIDIK